MEQVVEIRPDTTAEQQACGGLPRRTRTRQGKARLLTLATLDSRTAAAKAAHQLVETLTRDMGGHDLLTEGQRQLVTRAALLGAVIADFEARWVAGQPLAFSEYLSCVNAQRRLLVSLGLRRHARDVTPSLRAYLEQRGDSDDDIERS